MIFKGLSVAKNCLKPESAPLSKILYFFLFEVLLSVKYNINPIIAKLAINQALFLSLSY